MELFSSRLQNLFPAAKKILNDGRYWTRLSFEARLGAISLLLLLAWGLVSYQLVARSKQLQSLSSEISLLMTQSQNLEKQKKIEEAMQRKPLIATRDYLHQRVEKIPLLQGEKHRVEQLVKRFPDNPSLKERMLFLDSDQNRIRFEELKNHHNTDVEYHLAHPVQMDENDLRHFLETVEQSHDGCHREKPFLIMKKFELLKCYEKGDEKVYSIDVELLQK